MWLLHYRGRIWVVCRPRYRATTHCLLTQGTANILLLYTLHIISLATCGGRVAKSGGFSKSSTLVMVFGWLVITSYHYILIRFIYTCIPMDSRGIRKPINLGNWGMPWHGARMGVEVGWSHWHMLGWITCTSRCRAMGQAHRRCQPPQNQQHRMEGEALWSRLSKGLWEGKSGGSEKETLLDCVGLAEGEQLGLLEDQFALFIVNMDIPWGLSQKAGWD